MARPALALLLAMASAAAADAGISPHAGAPTGAHAALVGLLDVAIVYDDAPKPDARPARIDVRAQPAGGAPVLATIDTRGIAIGGLHHCLWRGATSGKAPESAPKLPRCPHWESGYEIPALAVFEARSDRWYRIAIDRGATRFGWVRSDEPFHALEALIASDDHLTYLTERWPRTLHDRAGGDTTTRVPRRAPPPGQSDATTPYRAVGRTRVGGELWIEIEVLDEVCGANDPRLIAKGWVPARRPGALIVWYHSRGC